jgi:hypothetical protein
MVTASKRVTWERSSSAQELLRALCRLGSVQKNLVEQALPTHQLFLLSEFFFKESCHWTRCIGDCSLVALSSSKWKP